MTTITVRVPEWLKKEMSRYKEINWADVIRDSIKRKLAELKQPTMIDDLIKEYIKQKNEIKLRTLDLFANFLKQYYILENIKIMYGEEAVDVAQEALSDLSSLGIKKPYDEIGNIEVSEIISSAFSINDVYDLFEEKLRKRLSNTNKYIEDAVWLLSQYGSRIVPDGFERTFKILHPDFEGDILNELVKIGILYKDYYESRAYSHLEYKVPTYATSILEEFTAKRIELIKENLMELVWEGWFKEFLEWMSEDSYPKVFEAYREDEIKEEYKKRYGRDFNEILSQLIKKYLVIIDYWPRRRRAGKRKSEPPYWVIKITPTALSLDTFITLLNSKAELR